MSIYVVLNEHTLGYFQNTDKIPTEPYASMGIIHASILKGSPYSNMSGTVTVSPSDKIRLATKEDFHNFRVCHKGYLL